MRISVKLIFSSLLFLCAAFIGSVGAGFAGVLEDGKAAFVKKDFQQAEMLFRRGYENGDPEATYFLARMAEMGLVAGEGKNFTVKLYLKGVQANHTASLNRVALMHYRGEFGLKKNDRKAGQYFKRAALAGDANAQFNYGKLIFEEKLGPRDLEETLNWYRKAADNDHVLALNTLGGLYRNGAKSDEDIARAKRYYLRSAMLGNAEGLFQTGRYVLSDHKDSDRLVTAHMYLNLSSSLQHAGARRLMQEVGKHLSLEELEQAQKQAANYKFAKPGQQKP